MLAPVRRRFAPPRLPQHVVHRGNDRGSVFKSDHDRANYLDCLMRATRRYECALHAYVLMDNHVHILATPDAAGALSRMMQWTASRYTISFNDQHVRSGTLWEGRFFSSAISSERYFMVCQRYIELNPVRAGMVGSPAEFGWSSYAHNALGIDDPLITEHDLYRRLGPTPAERCRAYRALFDPAMPEADLAAIRAALNGRRWLGDPPPDFAPTKRGRPRKAAPDANPAKGQLKFSSEPIIHNKSALSRIFQKE
jgi:putative transposase